MLKKTEYRRTYVVLPICPGVVALVLKSEDGVTVVEMPEHEDAICGALIAARESGYAPRHTA